MLAATKESGIKRLSESTEITYSTRQIGRLNGRKCQECDRLRNEESQASCDHYGVLIGVGLYLASVVAALMLSASVCQMDPQRNRKDIYESQKTFISCMLILYGTSTLMLYVKSKMDTCKIADQIEAHRVEAHRKFT